MRPSLSGFFEEIIQALILHIPLTPLARSAALCALPDVLVRPPSGLAVGGLAPVNINEIRQAGGRGSQFIHIKKRRQEGTRQTGLSLWPCQGPPSLCLDSSYEESPRMSILLEIVLVLT